MLTDQPKISWKRMFFFFSYPVFLKFVERLQRRRRKYVSQSESSAVVFVDGLPQKQKLVEDLEYLLFVKINRNPFSGV